jgi:hypothetical protein
MGLARPLLELNKALFPKIKTGFRNGTRHDSHTGRKSPAASNSKKRERKITDRRIHLKYQKAANAEKYGCTATRSLKNNQRKSNDATRRPSGKCRTEEVHAEQGFGSSAG